MKYTEEELEMIYSFDKFDLSGEIMYCCECAIDVPTIEYKEIIDNFILEGKSEIVNVIQCVHCNNQIEVNIYYK